MSEDAALIGIGIVTTVAYMVMGFGVARAVARMKGQDVRLFVLCFWPIALGVIAATGDIE
jgi:hypothetical protein